MMNDPGFWIKEDVISSEHCDEIAAALEGRIDRHRAGMRNLMAILQVRELANSRPLTELAHKVMGVPMQAFKATLFAKTGKANWLVAFHQDTALPISASTIAQGWGPESIKDGIIFAHAPTRALVKVLALRVHLDPSTDDNGPLRVIPNSHHHRIEDDQEFQRAIDSGRPVTCLVGKGGIIAMSPLLLHASSKCRSDLPRRVLHIEYTTDMDIDDGVKLAVS